MATRTRIKFWRSDGGWGKAQVDGEGGTGLVFIHHSVVYPHPNKGDDLTGQEILVDGVDWHSRKGPRAETVIRLSSELLGLLEQLPENLEVALRTHPYREWGSERMGLDVDTTLRAFGTEAGWGFSIDPLLSDRWEQEERGVCEDLRVIVITARWLQSQKAPEEIPADWLRSFLTKFLHGIVVGSGPSKAWMGAVQGVLSDLELHRRHEEKRAEEERKKKEWWEAELARRVSFDLPDNVPPTPYLELSDGSLLFGNRLDLLQKELRVSGSVAEGPVPIVPLFYYVDMVGDLWDDEALDSVPVVAVFFTNSKDEAYRVRESAGKLGKKALMFVRPHQHCWDFYDSGACTDSYICEGCGAFCTVDLRVSEEPPNFADEWLEFGEEFLEAVAGGQGDLLVLR